MPKTSKHVERPAIVLHDVKKTFKLKHAHSFKQAFISKFHGKSLSTDFNAVDGITFEVHEGESVALMGRNGSGKSTTLKLLSGVMDPDAGWIRVRGRVAGLLEVGAGFHPDLTGRENVYLNAAILGMSKEETDERFEEILAFSEIGEFIDTEVKRYSSGMYSRLGFSVAVHTALDTLLVDEILSVGDAAFRKKCEQKMLELQADGKTMFIVSHNASQVQKLCERGIVLDKGRIIFDGPIDEAIVVLQSDPQAITTTYPVTGEIYDLYSINPSKFGAPMAPQKDAMGVTPGIYQEFAKGIITSFQDGAVIKTFGLTKGIFLPVYQSNGGPNGDWGLVAGPATGRLERYEAKSVPFTNGVATMTLDNGMRFTPHTN